MILVDSSVWVDHLRNGDARLAALLQDGQVLSHPFVIGELALGHLKKRAMILADQQRLPKAAIARDEEVLRFIDRHTLYGLGIGCVDGHLLYICATDGWRLVVDARQAVKGRSGRAWFGLSLEHHYIGIRSNCRSAAA